MGLGLGLGLPFSYSAEEGGNPLLSLINKYGVPALLFDNSTVFTDALGTLPAGVGDVVGNESDLSGGGHDISQGTTAAKPILRTGPLLEFDGTDDHMDATSPFTGDEFTLIVCGRYRTTPASVKVIFGIGDTTAALATNYLALHSLANGTLLGTMVGSATTGNTIAANLITHRDFTTDGLFTFRTQDGSTKISDGINEATSTHVGNKAVLSGIDTCSFASLLGTTAGFFANFDMDYGFAINKYLTDSEQSQAEAYIAAQCGA